jgi:hypothetical protein
MEEARSNDGRMKISGKKQRLGIMFSSTFRDVQRFRSCSVIATMRAVIAGESATQIRFHGR